MGEYKKWLFWLLAIAAIIVGILLGPEDPQTRFHKKVVSESVQDRTISQCERAESIPPLLPIENALIWLGESNKSFDAANKKLEAGILARPDDAEVILVLIYQQIEHFKWNYERLNLWGGRTGDTISAGYQMEVKLCFIHWPTGAILGTATVWGENPPENINYSTKKVYGDWAEPIADLVNDLHQNKPQIPTETPVFRPTEELNP